MKLIAEPWDVGEGGYQVGNFPVLWAEWNGRYRDTVRRFWKGDERPALRLRLSSHRIQRSLPDRRPQVLMPASISSLRTMALPCAIWSATTRSTTKPMEDNNRTDRQQRLMEHGRRRADRRSRRSTRCASARCATFSPRCMLSQGVPMICGRRRARPHAERQQQRLLPGQRTRMVQLEADAGRGAAAGFHREADSSAAESSQPAPP